MSFGIGAWESIIATALYFVICPRPPQSRSIITQEQLNETAPPILIPPVLLFETSSPTLHVVPVAPSIEIGRKPSIPTSSYEGTSHQHLATSRADTYTTAYIGRETHVPTGSTAPNFEPSPRTHSQTSRCCDQRLFCGRPMLEHL